MSTDEAWEEWGKRDPYFAVITVEKYRNENISDEVKKEFFQSGERWINNVLKICRDHLDKDFTPKNALDFGCGTGRVVIPLAKISTHVTGIDVSDAMLQETQKNCDEYEVSNVSLLQSDDQLIALKGHFNFIHSFIVFQHIPIKRGREIFKNLLDHLEVGGIGVIHVTYAKTWFKENYGINPDVIGDIKLKGIFRKFLQRINQAAEQQSQELDADVDPEMQMNSYNINELLFIHQMAGIKKIHLEYTVHGGELGVILFFQK